MKRAWLTSFLLFLIFAGAALPVMGHASTLDSSEELAMLLPPSDSICEGNAYITTQAEWDQFAADYAGCTTFIGDITIDNSSAAIDSVYGLDSLQVMVGNLNISGVRIYGFANLDSLMGDLNLSAVDIYTHFNLSYVENLLIEHSGYNGTGTLQPSFNFDTNEWGDAFGSLQSCETLTIRDISTISSCFNSVVNARKIEIQSNLLTGYITDIFNSMVNADSVIINVPSQLSNSLQSLSNVGKLQLGHPSVVVLGGFDSCLGNLQYANTINIYVNSDVPNILPNLISVNLLWIEALGDAFYLELPLLPSLETIGSDFMISVARQNLNFPNLREIGGQFILVNPPPGVESISFPNLLHIGSSFTMLIDDSYIYNYGNNDPNDNLVNTIHTVDAPLLTSIGGEINLSGGINLTTCNSPAFCASSNYSPNWVFASGGPGCSSIAEIQARCLGSYASGTVYYDVNCDNEFNNDDALVSYPMLLQGDTLPIGSSDETGYFFVPLELNSTVSLYAQHTADWSTTGPVIITTDSTLQVVDNIHIGLCPVNIQHDVSVHLNASMQPRPGFTVRYNIIAQNEWPGSDSVSVTFDTSLMPGATITGYAAGGAQQGATVSFATDLLYGQSQVLWVDVLVPVGTPLGTAYTAAASIALVDSNDEDNHPENNTYSLQQTVIGSFDPNDKLVTPAIIDLLDVDSTATEWLEYTIRFQNTGTAEAIFVRVLDTLSQVFDMTSFELIATSHPCEVTFHDNHSIDWFFDNIMLPDSFTNEPESHGFIQFRIRTHALIEPSIIENAAGIYFDFNEPVITPPAITQVVICAEQGSTCDDGDACTVNDVIQADCVCAGTYADTDEDGVCDASEIAGCMDMEACNYAIDATDEDGSCTYVESLAIDGSAQATAGETVVYTYPGPALSAYAWSANPGAITAGQGTTQVSVVWESALSGIISVVETNNENCVGDTVMLAVSIEPSAVTAWSQEHLVVYPNPASDQINLIGNIPTGTPLYLYNSIGACVMKTPFASTIDVEHLPAGLYHVRISLANVRLEQSFVILR